MKMLLNLSNHTIKRWDKKQLLEAEYLFGKVVDLPFPAINPLASEAEIEELSLQYLNVCTEKLFSSQEKNNGVHIMGELTFVFSLVKKLLEKDIICIASTTERNVKFKNNIKTAEFNFVKFRKYL